MNRPELPKLEIENKGDDMSTNTIDVTNPGPIEGVFSIDLSKGPGVYELRGARGTGKSTILSSIELLSGHKVDITLHDGALSGKVEGLGVVAPIGGRKRRKGELTCDTIDAEKFSLTDLLDPPGKTPEVRDAHAIKALAVLSEVKADQTLYYEIAGGQAEFDGLGIAETTDPVMLATRVKAAFDKLATQAARTAEAEAKHAIPLEHVPDGLDMSQSSDLVTLGGYRDHARDTLRSMQTDRENGQFEERGAALAKERLEEVEEGYSGPTSVAAQAAQTDTKTAWNASVREVERLGVELVNAKSVEREKSHDHAIAAEQHETAKQHDQAVASLTDTATKEVEYPGLADVDDAAAAVSEATVAYDLGVRIHDAKKNHEIATIHRDAEKTAEKEAAGARNKAGQVFDILAQSLNMKHLEVQNVDGFPRLFVQHQRRGKTAFDRVNGLSDGERVDFALRELFPHIDSPGLLPIPQRAWQDLQPTDRMNVHKLAAENGLCIFGAQVDDGELRVVFLGDELEEDK